MQGREWGEHIPDEPERRDVSSESARRRTESEEERAKQERERKLTPEDMARIKEEKRQREEDAVGASLGRLRSFEDVKRSQQWGEHIPEEQPHERTLTPSEMRRKSQEEDERKERERKEKERRETRSVEEIRREKFENSPEQVAKREQTRREEWEKAEKERRFQDEQARKSFEALRKEKAPDELVDSLVKEKLTMDLGDGKSVDLTEAVPDIARRIRDRGRVPGNDADDAERAAGRLLENLKTIKGIAKDALMYGRDHAKHLDVAAEQFKEQAFAMTRRFKVDLAGGGGEGGKEGVAEKRAAETALDAALKERGIDIMAYKELVAVERSGEKKRDYANRLKAIREKFEAGTAADDADLRKEIDAFAKDVRTGRDENYL